MTKRKIYPLITPDLVQRSENHNRSALVERGVNAMQLEGIVTVVARRLQSRLSQSTAREVPGKVALYLNEVHIDYLGRISELTGLSVNQLVNFALEEALVE